jgi:DNA polymerase III delta subunit
MVYLFIGKDSPAKDIALKQIKSEVLPRGLEQFNFDLLYAGELSLRSLQEKLLAIPAKSSKRVLVIRNAGGLKKDLETFILAWSKEPRQNFILVLDIEEQSGKEHFIRSIAKYAKITRFKESAPLNTFSLSRQIEERRPDNALKTLSQLIKDGERPERILGGLRYSLENNMQDVKGLRRRLKLLLNCDIEIKTGKLKPVFALEKLVVNLCALSQPFH